MQSWAVFHAAYAALSSWVRLGIAPPHAQPLDLTSAGPPATFVRDQNGIVQGGVRLPDVAVPTALNNGVNGPASLANPLSVFCVLYGTNVPFTQAQLSSLYPSNAVYRAKVAADVARLIGQHFLLPADGLTFIEEAQHTSVTG